MNEPQITRKTEGLSKVTGAPEEIVPLASDIRKYCNRIANQNSTLVDLMERLEI